MAAPSHTSIANHRTGYAITSWVGQLLLIGQMIVVTIVLARLHKLVPHSVNDTPGYLNFPFDSLKDSLNSIRTPGYPVFLKVVAWCGSLSMVAWAHWACYCFAWHSR